MSSRVKQITLTKELEKLEHELDWLNEIYVKIKLEDLYELDELETSSQIQENIKSILRNLKTTSTFFQHYFNTILALPFSIPACFDYLDNARFLYILTSLPYRMTEIFYPGKVEQLLQWSVLGSAGLEIIDSGVLGCLCCGNYCVVFWSEILLVTILQSVLYSAGGGEGGGDGGGGDGGGGGWPLRLQRV